MSEKDKTQKGKVLTLKNYPERQIEEIKKNGKPSAELAEEMKTIDRRNAEKIRRRTN